MPAATKPEKTTTPKKDAPAPETEAQDEEPSGSEVTAKSGDNGKEPDPDPLETLEPYTKPKVWIIGKPPSADGNENEWSKYVQRPLGYMARLRFFALVADVFSQAMRESDGGGFSDLGDLAPLMRRGRGGGLTAADFSDATSFMQLATRLLAVAPDFLLDCYVLWLDVPPAERGWAKAVMDQPHLPEEDKWGLSDDDGLEIIEVFIDQNYEEIRRFFTEKLPRIAERVQQKEEERNRALAQSKQ